MGAKIPVNSGRALRYYRSSRLDWKMDGVDAWGQGESD